MQVVRLDCKVSQDFCLLQVKQSKRQKKTCHFCLMWGILCARKQMLHCTSLLVTLSPVFCFLVSLLLVPHPLFWSVLFSSLLLPPVCFASLVFFLLFWTSAQLRFCLWHACPLVWSNPLDLPRPSATGDQQIILFTADGDCRGKQAILFLFPALFLLVLGSWLWLGGPLANLMHNTLVTEVWSVRKEWEPKVLDINIKEGKKKKRKINRYLVTFVVCFR